MISSTQIKLIKSIFMIYYYLQNLNWYINSHVILKSCYYLIYACELLKIILLNH